MRIFRRAHARKLLGVSVMALMTGCSTLSSMNPFAAKDKGTNPAPLVELKGSMAVRTAWKVDIGKAAGYTFSPTLVDNSVLVAGADGALARVEVATGRELWRVRATSGLSSSAGSDGTIIAIGADKGGLLTYDMNGKPLWTAQVSSEVLSAPLVSQGVVVVRSIDNRIVAFDAATGAQKWTVQRVAPVLTLRNAPGMVVTGKDVLIAQPGGKLLSITLATGAQRWEVAVGESRGATELDRVTDIGGNPVLFEGDVCAVTFQGRVGCFDAATGAARWTKELSSNGGVAVDQRFVFAVDDKGSVYAFNRDTGASAWKNDKLAFRSPSTPVSYGRAVAVGDYQGYIHFMSREDGAFLARVATVDSPITSQPIVAGSNLIFQSQSGIVTAIAVE
jgi:outer membrane protein assembly factor BamB